MLDVIVRPAAYADVDALRRLYRAEAQCQIVHDSALARGIADPYVVLADARVAGYAGVWNRYHPGRLMEFYLLPSVRLLAAVAVREVLQVSGATHIEAQTNMPRMLGLFFAAAKNVMTEKILFEDAFVSDLVVPGAAVRRARPEDRTSEAEWVLEVDGRVVGDGGILDHYNPPYGDIYMEVHEPERGKGYGAYLVQELKRIGHESGRRPAARCDPDNLASRRTLEKAGFQVCGRLLVGEIDGSRESDLGRLMCS